jgi:hypothetical protein
MTCHTSFDSDVGAGPNRGWAWLASQAVVLGCQAVGGRIPIIEIIVRTERPAPVTPELRRVVGWPAPVVALLVECYYLGFSMLDYSSERNKMTAQQSIDFIGRHKGLAIGNGIVFYILHLLPIIGWLLAPSYAVIAATLSLHHAQKKHVIIR